MNKMNPEVKAKWVAALRGGAYQQAKGYLHKDGGFCCLGVLCDLFQPNWLPCDGIKKVYRYDDSAISYPPKKVEEWAGFLGEAYGIAVEIDGAIQPLAEHNDAGRTFAEIADAIEAQL